MADDRVLAASVGGVGHGPETNCPCDLGGFGLSSVLAEVLNPAVHADLSAPSPRGAVPCDTAISRRRPRPAASILAIGAQGRHRSQVRPPVIQLVAVDVVPFESVTRRQPEDISVHPDVYALAVRAGAPHGVPSTERPCPLAQPIRVGGIDPCVEAIGIGPSQTDESAPVIQDDDLARSAVADGGALPGAVHGASTVDLIDGAEEVCTAVTADARDATLLGHRASPVLGVRPVLCYNSARATRVELYPTRSAA
jgi:hypothetical protein